MTEEFTDQQLQEATTQIKWEMLNQKFGIAMDRDPSVIIWENITYDNVVYWLINAEIWELPNLRDAMEAELKKRNEELNLKHK
jgi:hypothetical protein